MFEWVAMIALFAGGLANMAAASRLMFSLSRDNMLPGRAALAKVSPTTHSPSARWSPHRISVLLVTVGTYIATEAMTLIVGMASVGYYASALTIAAVIWAARSGRLSGQSTFDLGRSAMPVRWAALVWSIFVVGVLTVPDVNHKTAMMAGGFFVLAAIWYAARLRGAIDRGEAGTPAQRTAQRRAGGAVRPRHHRPRAGLSRTADDPRPRALLAHPGVIDSKPYDATHHDAPGGWSATTG